MTDTDLPVLEPQEESIPRSLVPYNRDDDRSRYLGLRSSGFTIREALNLLGKAKSTLSHWRNDEEFASLEQRLPEIRRELGYEYAALEYLRNYRLVLEKDCRVLNESLRKRTITNDKGEVAELPMNSQDHKYLLQLRSHYTPQQLLAVEQLFGKKSDEEVNFTDLVLMLSRETKVESVKIETVQRKEAGLARLTEGSIDD